MDLTPQLSLDQTGLSEISKRNNAKAMTVPADGLPTSQPSITGKTEIGLVLITTQLKQAQLVPAGY